MWVCFGGVLVAVVCLSFVGLFVCFGDFGWDMFTRVLLLELCFIVGDFGLVGGLFGCLLGELLGYLFWLTLVCLV